jgi:hypothetical protein
MFQRYQLLKLMKGIATFGDVHEQLPANALPVSIRHRQPKA